MTALTRALLFLVSCVFTQNFIFVRLLGDSSPEEAHGVGASAVVGLYTTVVMTLSSTANWLVYRKVLVPLNVGSLYLVTFALVVLCAAWIAGALLKKLYPALGENGIALAANCAVLGASLLGMKLSFIRATLTGLFGGLGFLLAMVLLAGVRERLEFSKVPKSMKGLPITLVSAGLIALAFMGFIGL